MKLQDEAICKLESRLHTAHTSVHGLQQRIRRSNEKAEAKRIQVESVALGATIV